MSKTIDELLAELISLEQTVYGQLEEIKKIRDDLSTQEHACRNVLWKIATRRGELIAHKSLEAVL